MTIQEVFSHYSEDMKGVEVCMQRGLSSEVALIGQVVQHLIGGGGKRFRPLLLLVSSDLCGYHGDRRFAMAAMIEFIHTATLLHDDVIDHAEIRRGRAAANALWGNAASVLVGDYLYSRSFQLLTEDGNLSILRLISRTTNLMSEGEVFQLTKIGDANLTEADYQTIIEKKTALLIAAACAIGAILAGDDPEREKILYRLGLCLGSAFQITDDTLDYTADERAFGKTIGKDLQEGKMTLPLIHALRQMSETERREILATFRDAVPGGEGWQYISALVRRYGGIEYARGQAERFIEEAKSLVVPFPDAPPRAALFAVADYILARNL